eukprot:CAMPEP_0172180640 /NCGR_PEP_ID=MMETSP1050-20130122/17357_1 /TAXON_ID=233186 /ORGANISM="Cryptomonas curvata, Strain CCAP979/52" /LENGTH=35 /DNA_ID= /DNA_START= /DNA_END= /DNA_ORIENTATION=
MTVNPSHEPVPVPLRMQHEYESESRLLWAGISKPN